MLSVMARPVAEICLTISGCVMGAPVHSCPLSQFRSVFLWFIFLDWHVCPSSGLSCVQYGSRNNRRHPLPALRPYVGTKFVRLRILPWLCKGPLHGATVTLVAGQRPPCWHWKNPPDRDTWSDHWLGRGPEPASFQVLLRVHGACALRSWLSHPDRAALPGPPGAGDLAEDPVLVMLWLLVKIVELACACEL